MDRSTELRLRTSLAAICREGTTNLAAEVRHVPAEDYVDPDRHRLEVQALFRSVPLAAAVSCELRHPGDFITDDLAGLPVLIVRGEDGRVRCVLNACRHRGNTVCQEATGNRRRFRCGYHGWTYDTGGRCRLIPDPDAFAGLDDSQLDLVELPCEERHGLIWVVPDPEGAIDVEAYLGNALDGELAGHDLADHWLFRDETLTEPFNWKLGVDTFEEVYHVKFLHPESLKGLFTPYAHNETFNDLHARLTVVRQSFVDECLDSDAEPLLPHVSIDYHLFPNTVLIWQMDHIELWHFSPDPNDVHSCRVKVRLLVPEEPDERATRYWNRNWEVLEQSVWHEDFATMRSIHRNLASGATKQLTFGRNEFGLHHYHDALDRVLGQVDCHRPRWRR